MSLSPEEKRKANQNHFIEQLERIKEGGVYIWKDENILFRKQDGKFVIPNARALHRLERILDSKGLLRCFKCCDEMEAKKKEKQAKKKEAEEKAEGEKEKRKEAEKEKRAVAEQKAKDNDRLARERLASAEPVTPQPERPRRGSGEERKRKRDEESKLQLLRKRRSSTESSQRGPTSPQRSQQEVAC